ncbi:MAG TPA: helix-turn-helix domain-containing protein [Burkholderiaceae bacterium]|nr:helix-turn-helix domain-containing protein [Burkholderiaceae bacterium]
MASATRAGRKALATGWPAVSPIRPKRRCTGKASSMSDDGTDEVRSPTTAGGLLRQARQAQGLHIAALAAAIKVTPRKLELLESDQIDALPDATFARALAQTVCRALKIDAAPVLALLPPPSGYRLSQLGEGLNMTYRDQPGRLASANWAGLANSTLWVAILLVVAAGVVYLMPSDWIERVQAIAAPVAHPDTSVAVGAASAPAATDVMPVAGPPTSSAVAAEPVELAASAAAAVAPPASAASAEPVAPPASAVPTAPAMAEVAASATSAPRPAPGANGGMVQLRTSAASWIEVIDAQGKVLLSRVLAPDESLTLDGVAPLKLKIGNAAGTRLVFRGKPVDLTPFTRNNVARLELK